MFKKRTVKGNARKRETPQTTVHEGEEDVILTSAKGKSRSSKFESKSTTRKRQRDGGEAGSSNAGVRTFASSRDARPAEYSGGATAELLIDTAKEHDARTLHEKNVDFNQARSEQLNENARTEQGEKEYRGEANQINRITKTKEQIANNKVTGAFGPIRAPTNIRMTNRFDYQPDICKDYKETGFCGYGDSCKFLHDRSDYKAGWQLENDWNEQQKKKQARIAKGLPAEEEPSGNPTPSANELPFACHICRLRFTNPVVTPCGHYFCSKCALARFRKTPKCAVCMENTRGMFNRAEKIIQRDSKLANGN